MCGLKSKLIRFNEIFSQTKNNLFGTKYRDYYLAEVEKTVSKDSSWKMDVEKEYQLDYLKSHGVKPNMTFLDYGCGPLSAGRYFIDYLESEKYIGVDISERVLEIGKKRIKKFGLIEKKPQLFHLPWGSFEPLEGKIFDIIWCNGVFSHTSPEDIKFVVKNFSKMMDSNSIFYVTFGLTKGNTFQRNFRSWRYNLEFFEKISKEYGLNVEFLADWASSTRSLKTETDMLKFVKAN